MACLLFISVLLSVVVTSFSEKVTCGSNEVLRELPEDCPYDYCPKDRFTDKTPCVKSDAASACKCSFNYRRADNGTCIPTTECPPFKCPANEVFNPCPSYCPTDDCRDALLGGECPYLLLIVVFCSPTCRCADGYFRKDGICVTYEECPNVQQAKLIQNGETTRVTEVTTLQNSDKIVPEKQKTWRKNII